MTDRKIIMLFLICLLPAILGSCSLKPPKPWQRGQLSQPAMQLTHPFDTRFDEHLYFSRESTNGGQGFSAGGCGCN